MDISDFEVTHVVMAVGTTTIKMEYFYLFKPENEYLLNQMTSYFVHNVYTSLSFSVPNLMA